MLPIFAEIRQRFGDHAIQPLSALPSAKPLGTGVPALDQLLVIGGLPRGHLTVFAGEPTSGASTLAYLICAQQQAFGGTVVWIDQTQQVDAEYAARCGVQVENLLLLRPADRTQGYTLLRDLLAQTSAEIVLWLGDLALPAALTALLRRTRVVLLAIRTLPLNADVVLGFQRSDWLYRDGDVRGYRAQVRVLHHRLASPSPGTVLDVTFDGLVQGDAT